MGKDQQGNISDLRIKNDPVADCTIPTGHEFDDIDPIKTPTTALIACIHKGMQHVNALVQIHPTFTNKIIPEETLFGLCKSKDTKEALDLLHSWSKSDSAIKAVKKFIVWSQETKSLINYYLKQHITTPAKTTKIAHCFKCWCNYYINTINKLLTTNGNICCYFEILNIYSRSE